MSVKMWSTWAENSWVRVWTGYSGEWCGAGNWGKKIYTLLSSSPLSIYFLTFLNVWDGVLGLQNFFQLIFTIVSKYN